jgi:predicted Rossmann fold flavoprotein
MLVIDLKPALDLQVLDARLKRDIAERSRKQFSNLLAGLLPASLIPVISELTKINGEKLCNQIIKDERLKLAAVLKGIKIEISGSAGMDEAIVTSGGVSINEINPSTMESKLISGLYFAGEVMDIDGYTGGYNLTAAFCTGRIAGTKGTG